MKISNYNVILLQEVQKVLIKANKTDDEIVSFTSTSLLDILKEFSKFSLVRVVVGYVIMVSEPHSFS